MIDTVVVPAQDEGFREVFIGEKRWYPLRIRADIQQQLKYVAVYRVAPISAITHIAVIRSIEPWKTPGQVVINFAGPPTEIGPITLGKGGIGKAPQTRRYATRQAIERAQRSTTFGSQGSCKCVRS